MVKLSKDNKIKNQNIQNLQIIKTKQKKSHSCETISVRMERFSKFFTPYKTKAKKTNSQKREKAIASVQKKLKFRVFSLSGEGQRRLL